jgi:hypothetical protein
MFHIVKFLNISIEEAYLLPVSTRKWFIKRSIEQNTPNEQQNKPQKFKHPYFEKKGT